MHADAFIVNFEKDNFRTTPLALIFYQTGYLSYVILPEGLSVGDKLSNPLTAQGEYVASDGAAVPLKYINDGALVFNVEL